MLRKDEAIARAIKAGATMEEINVEAEKQARQVGTVPFNNMLRALNMMTYSNTVADWTRLAAGMIARADARKRK
jgi:hypothetical protein